MIQSILNAIKSRLTERKVLTLYGNNNSKIDFIKTSETIVVKTPNNQISLTKMEVSFLQNAIEGVVSFMQWLTGEHEQTS